MEENEWTCVNKATGEELTIKEFDELRYEGRKQAKGFQFSYLRVLENYLDVAKSPSLKILFLKKIRKFENLIKNYMQ